MLKNAIWLFVVAALILFVFLPSYTRMEDLRSKNEEYQKQLVTLKRENMQLIEERRLLKDDPAYLEKVAREKMGLVKEGEVVYKIVPAGEEK